MTAFWFTPAKDKLASKLLELDADDLQLLLVMSDSTASTNRSAEFVADLDAGAEVLDEYDGSGYARQTLTGKVLVTGGQAERLEADPCVFGGGALGEGTRMAAGAVLIKNTGSDATSPVLLFTDEGGFPWQATGARDVTFNWPAGGLTALDDSVAIDVELLVPELRHVPTGRTGVFYLESLIRVPTVAAATLGGYSFEFTLLDGGSATLYADRWEYSFAAAGTYNVLVEVKLGAGVVASATAQFVAYAAPTFLSLRNVLCIGDSLMESGSGGGASGDLVDKVADELVAAQNTQNFVGTVSAQGHGFEAYGGVTYAYYTTSSSPFWDGAEIDLGWYTATHLAGVPPFFGVIFLGHNDIFSTDPTPTAIAAAGAAALADAEALIAELKEELGGTKWLVCSVTVPNQLEAAFTNNYPGVRTRDEYRLLQHAFARQQMDHFSGREGEGLYFVPLWPHLDPVGGYRVASPNALHPDTVGTDQLGAVLFEELMWLMDQ